MHAGIIADLGQTPNSTVTLQHLVANDPQVRWPPPFCFSCIDDCACHAHLWKLTAAFVGPQYAVIIGDLTYSDDYTADQLPNRFYTGAYLGQVIQPTLNPIATSYQPRVKPKPAT